VEVKPPSDEVTELPPLTESGYRHEALLYSGQADFMHSTLEFIEQGLSRAEPMFVVVDEEKIDALCRELGSDHVGVRFADMTDVGANPARIIGVWHTFLAEHAGVAVRGIGEPIYVERSSDELAECQLHEALLNVAVSPSRDFWLLCPYDVESLPADVVGEAFRTHPYVANGADRRCSGLYRHPEPATVFAGALASPPESAVGVAFGASDVAALRRLAARAASAHFLPAQIDDVVVVVSELATNAVQHGSGGGTFRSWFDGDVLYVEITDSGHFEQLLAGRLPPGPAQPSGRGMWIANQICDLLQIRTSVDGTVIRGQIRRIGSVEPIRPFTGCVTS
jgi:anti-sigma regulatory factor (Ser/Thr protein kinase)